MWPPFRDIITKRFTTLSTRIWRISADEGLLTLCSLLALLVGTSTAAKSDDVIPRVHSWHRRYSQGPESLYLSYSGNPWDASSSATLLHDNETRFLWKTPRNDSTAATKAKVTARVSSSLKRSKRGVVHLYNMVVCATGCNPLAYKGYGCYCGFLGSGFTIDGIDRCCKMHDWCYEATDCPMFMEYFVPYYWKCYRGNKPICAVEHGDLGGSGSCAQRLCECDRALAECLRRYPCPRTKAMCTSSPWRLVQNLFMLI